MVGQDMAREALTPSQKRYLHWGVLVAVISAFPILAVVVFGVRPFMPDGTERIDDLLVLIAGFFWLQAAVLMIIFYMVGPKDPDTRRLPLSHVLISATRAAALLLTLAGQGLIDPRLNFAIVLVLIAASFWFSWRIWRVSDELRRAVKKETDAANYLVLTCALMVYAVGERLGVLGGVTAWGVMALVMLVSFPISIWVAVSRGMAQVSKDD